MTGGGYSPYPRTMSIERTYIVYLLASMKGGTLYCGITSDIVRRMWEHQTGAVRGFTSKYKVHRLVWFEVHTDVLEAIAREKRIKKWPRQWKIDLIEKDNPGWNDLLPRLLSGK